MGELLGVPMIMWLRKTNKFNTKNLSRIFKDEFLLKKLVKNNKLAKFTLRFMKHKIRRKLFMNIYFKKYEYKRLRYYRRKFRKICYLLENSRYSKKSQELQVKNIQHTFRGKPIRNICIKPADRKSVV